MFLLLFGQSLTVKVEDILLRNEEYFKKAGIELLLNTTCTKLDAKSQLIYLSDGSNLNYDKLFIATGSRYYLLLQEFKLILNRFYCSPRKYGTLGDDVQNAFYMRTYQDAANIAEHSKDKNVVLIGSSFIGL